MMQKQVVAEERIYGDIVVNRVCFSHVQSITFFSNHCQALLSSSSSSSESISEKSGSQMPGRKSEN